MTWLPRHKTGLVERLRVEGRYEEADQIENGAGFSLGVVDDGVVWIISGGRRERLFERREARTAIGRERIWLRRRELTTHDWGWVTGPPAARFR